MDVDARLVGRVHDLLNARNERPRPEVKREPGLKLMRVEDAADELYVYDEIGFWGVMAADVAAQLDGHRGDLHVRVNSPGGDVFDGFAIFNMLANLDGNVTVTVEGLAASAASVIAMAGDSVRMMSASQLMIHDASGLCIGNAGEMRAMVDVLDSISATIAQVYADHAGGDAEQWRAAMLAETWYTPTEAVAAGLADEVLAPKRRDQTDDSAPAAASFDLTVFQYAGRIAAPAPTATAAEPTPPEPPAPAPVAVPFPADVFRAAMREAVTTRRAVK
ncbi:head maturation protease, ClpP-related [Amycolatopsis sp. NPDC001319]|uniref:head maturation protease, ClpP-related n=1 Tax=unclassified Amycolatopsis TaxID=2618356 RepID=UPI003690DE16